MDQMDTPVPACDEGSRAEWCSWNTHFDDTSDRHGCDQGLGDENSRKCLTPLSPETDSAWDLDDSNIEHSLVSSLVIVYMQFTISLEVQLTALPPRLLRIRSSPLVLIY